MPTHVPAAPEQVALSELRMLAAAQRPGSSAARAWAAVLAAVEEPRWHRPRVYRLGSRLYVVEGAGDPEEDTLVMRRLPPPPSWTPPGRRR